MEYEKTQPQFMDKIDDEKSVPLEKSYLVAMTGPQAGTVFTLSDGSMIVGRQPTADIFLNDHQVSRNHAEFVTSMGETQVHDLGSTNGTFLNGEKLEKKVAISDGDEVQLGATCFRFSIHNPIDGNRLGLSNHGYFETRLHEELDRASRYKRDLSVLMISPAIDPKEILDKAKLLSDHYPDVVEKIRGIIRTMDLLAHYGKYELELLLPETSKKDALILAERILADATFGKDENLSIGMASFPEDGRTPDILLERSRLALKKARTEKKTKPVVDLAEERHRLILSNEKEVIVRSEKMKELFDVIERIAKSTITVLIQGETGVGKEVVAETIHTKSDRSKDPLVCVNCAALTETLLESELFGHEKGSFTGADQTKIGLFESANGGTIFLDEIGEMPLKTQAKLLRVLQAKKIMRVGSNKEINTDVRIIAATNRKLEKQVEEKNFREDLFYRLNAATLTIPPLRERKKEVPYLVQTFIKECCEENGIDNKDISPDALDILMKYSWPGNIRELRNTVERAVVISEGETIYKEALTSRLTSDVDQITSSSSIDNLDAAVDSTMVGDMKEVIAAYERDLIINALKKTQWNQTKASEILNVPRRTLVSKIKKYKIKEDE
ncbi:MAG: sigma 54-interacting transcriptional regulator [Bdellovibrionales bacterium]|nr:sigma 54-interacting transcriptional regulator [Bdellovibrionales bacterium]